MKSVYRFGGMPNLMQTLLADALRLWLIQTADFRTLELEFLPAHSDYSLENCGMTHPLTEHVTVGNNQLCCCVIC